MPPGRLLFMNNQCSSRESAGEPSLKAVLIADPRCRGTPHGLSTVARSDTQMSFPPKPPMRSDVKYRLRPSYEIAGPWSLNREFTTDPRLTGLLHSEKCGAAAGRCAATPKIIRRIAVMEKCTPFSRSLMSSPFGGFNVALRFERNNDRRVLCETSAGDGATDYMSATYDAV